MNGFALRPAEIECDEGAVYNGSEPGCVRDESELVSSWSWDMTKCTDMLPFDVHGRTVKGAFLQVSSAAMHRGIYVGSSYELRFEKKPQCNYEMRVLSPDGTRVVYQEAGPYNWTRASRTSATDGIGGNNMHATLVLTSGDTLWIARERFHGTFQSHFGIASFDVSK